MRGWGLGALHPTLALELETSDFVPRLQKIFAPRGNMSNWVSDLWCVAQRARSGEKHALGMTSNLNPDHWALGA